MDNGVTCVAAIEKRLAFAENFVIFRKNKSGKYAERRSHERSRFKISPRAMCAGAIYWSGVSRLVYGLSKQRLSRMQNQQIYWQLFLPCREIFARGQREIAVEGPMLEAEAELVHKNYWK